MDGFGIEASGGVGGLRNLDPLRFRVKLRQLLFEVFDDVGAVILSRPVLTGLGAIVRSFNFDFFDRLTH